MKKWKHLNFEQSKTIASGIAHNYKLKDIANLINSRRGLDLDDDKFEILDSIIKNGVDNNKSIYQIKIENNEILVY